MFDGLELVYEWKDQAKFESAGEHCGGTVSGFWLNDGFGSRPQQCPRYSQKPRNHGRGSALLRWLGCDIRRIVLLRPGQRAQLALGFILAGCVRSVSGVPSQRSDSPVPAGQIKTSCCRTRRSTEWRPRHAAWQFRGPGGAATGELSVRTWVAGHEHVWTIASASAGQGGAAAR